MSFDYTSLQNTADRLISKFGRSVTLRRVTAGTYDPSNLSVSGDSNADTTVTVAIMNYEEREIDGSVIKRQDMRGYLAAKNTALPSVSDIIIDGSVQYQIVNIRELKPATTSLLYELQLRK